MRIEPIGPVLFLLMLVPCHAAEDHKIVTYEQPVQCIRGNIADVTSSPVSLVNISVFDHPEVWSDRSLNFTQKRERQHEITATVTDERGRFSIKKLPAGRYEVLLEKGGFDPLSVIVRVDAAVPCKKLCVHLCPSGACFQKPKVQECK